MNTYPPKLRINAPLLEYHSITWMIHVGKYKLRNIRYIIDAHWSLCHEKLEYVRVYYINNVGENYKSAYSLSENFVAHWDSSDLNNEHWIKHNDKFLIFSTNEINIHSYDDLEKILMGYIKADWQKRYHLKENEVLFDQLYLHQNPDKYKIYDEKNLWKNFSGMDWNLILSTYPQFADRCDAVNGWKKIEHFSWIHLLKAQPKFMDKFLEFMNDKAFNYWEFLIIHDSKAMQKCENMGCISNIDMSKIIIMNKCNMRLNIPMAIVIHLLYPHLSNLDVIKETLQTYNEKIYCDNHDEDEIAFLYSLLPELTLSIFNKFNVVGNKKLIAKFKRSKSKPKFQVLYGVDA